MTTSTGIETQVLPLVPGDKLTRGEFLRRWESMPDLKSAELIDGIVYMPSPLSFDHGEDHAWIITWLGTYMASTPGTAVGDNVTWYMLDDAAQPDAYLRILPEHGGQSLVRDNFGEGAPEFAAEVCLSSSSYDLHQKLALYESAGVQEYLALLVVDREFRWHRLVDGRFETVNIPHDGIFRSDVFPGLWLNVEAFLDGRLSDLLTTLSGGLATPEHRQFSKRLRQTRDLDAE